MIEEDNEPLLSHSQDLAEEAADKLYAPCEESTKFKFPLAYATLKIDMSLFNEDQRKCVYEAEKLLHKAGVRFDCGSGSGCRDWELDWSLCGAFLSVRQIDCSNYHKHKKPLYLSYVYWAIYEDNEHISANAYCSVDCRKDDIQRQEADGCKVVWLGESKVMELKEE